MRYTDRKTSEAKGNGLWGGRSGSGTRANGLWGHGSKATVLLATLLSVSLISISAPTAGADGPGKPDFSGPQVPASLLAAAQANPAQVFHVIVQGSGRGGSERLAQKVANWAAHSENRLQDAANQADAAARHAQNTAATLDAQASQAQQNAGQAQANATAKVVRAKLDGKKADKNAATQAAQDATAKAQAAAQAQQDAHAAQSAVGQAQADVASAQSAFGAEADTIVKHHLKDAFSSITGDAMTLTGEQIIGLANHGNDGLISITPDVPLSAAGDYQNAEMWRQSTGVAALWDHPGAPAPQAPAIAIVDSGIDASKAADFGSRVIASVNLSSLDPNATGDSDGHGTMVAGIAAGASSSEPGVAQNAPLVDVHTANGQGQSMTSDVVAACDWILAHKAAYNIRVANFSLVAPQPTTFQFDPLDQAVESLWLNGIVVTAAAGNQRTDSNPVDMSGAPGNDPFIITVGAVDQNQTPNTSDDTIAPWSAYGYTADGFQKPELSAPGRYLIMPVPDGAYVPSQVPDRIVAPGYMWMSGTSFSAPMVAGAAAQILALHPDWTPDQVKGALMLSASPLPLVTDSSGGVGELNAAAAAAVINPPNPNAGLDQFLTTNPTSGGTVFDAAAWSSAAWSSAAWSSAAWSSAAWSSAAWSSAAWSSAAWSSAAWSSAAWSSAAWSSAAWSSAAWSSAAWSSTASSSATWRP
jgi:serine protease AprX